MKLYVETDKGIFCLACPRTCNLSAGRGYCGVCSVKDDKFSCDVCELVSSIANDPIEKKPVFHYLPGSTVLSVGTLGCNMRCIGCQNWEIAHADLDTYRWNLQRITASELVALAKRVSDGLAWTYNEPTVWAEYVYDGACLAKEEGLYTVVATNGYYSIQTFKLWEPVVDVFRIDLKGFTDETYEKFAPGVKASVILGNIERAVSCRKHVEIVTNVMPGVNDGDLEAIADFIKSLNPEIPWHLTRFFPQFKMQNVPPTPVSLLTRARQMALEKGLKYVYLGNVNLPGMENTVCPRCGNLLIERKGLFTVENYVEQGSCPRCGNKIYGRFGG